MQRSERMRLRWNVRLAVLACIAVLATVLLWPRMPRVAARALASADTYELLSLEPERSETPTVGDFHRHKVLGRTVVTDSSLRQHLDETLRAGVEPFYTSRPKCFSPRLGIRATAGGRTTDFVICFGCKQAQVWQDDRVVADWTTNRTPKAAFNQVLLGAGVTLAADDD